MKNIFVNATASTEGGLNTIVIQFIESIFINDSINNYYVFVSTDYFSDYNQKNVKIIKVNKKGWIQRFLWDSFQMKIWSKKNNIHPNLIVSLQNTPVRFNVPQLIYVHTPIPFVGYSWNVFKVSERRLWFYKYIFPFFIKLYFRSNSEIIVQTHWLKKKVLTKLKIKNEKLIHVIKPEVYINPTKIKNLPTENQKKIFFFPSRDFIYKNHATILRAIHLLKKQNKNLHEQMAVIFTVPKESTLYSEASQLNVTDCVNFVGALDYEAVLHNYATADAILFPSYIETFGLPLVESAMFGKLILCADEDYAKEVVGDSYEGVQFIPAHAQEQWALKMQEVLESDRKLFSYNPEIENNGWKSFFDLIKQKVANNVNNPHEELLENIKITQ